MYCRNLFLEYFIKCKKAGYRENILLEILENELSICCNLPGNSIHLDQNLVFELSGCTTVNELKSFINDLTVDVNNKAFVKQELPKNLEKEMSQAREERELSRY